MRTAIILAAALLAAGCASTRPVYQSVPAAIGSPSMSAQQAASICAPQARYAGQRAMAEVTARYTARQSENAGYRCETVGSNGVYDSRCKAQPRRYSSPLEGLAQGQDEASAREVVERAVFTQCMAEKGWGFEQQCFENCGDHVDRPSNPNANSKHDGEFCRQSEECEGLCVSGVCKSPWSSRSPNAVGPNPQVRTTQPVLRSAGDMCANHQDCAGALMCLSGYCRENALANAGRCAGYADCPSGQTCQLSTGTCKQLESGPRPATKSPTTFGRPVPEGAGDACKVNSDCKPGTRCVAGYCG